MLQIITSPSVEHINGSELSYSKETLFPQDPALTKWVQLLISSKSGFTVYDMLSYIQCFILELDQIIFGLGLK